jgi:hypothetical protein
LFYRWLVVSDRETAVTAGLGLGAALCTKLTWLPLLILWPLLWAFVFIRNQRWRLFASESCQLLCILVVGLVVLNASYGFSGSFSRFADFEFVSQTFRNATTKLDEEAGILDVTSIPVPLPRDYLLGLDLQQRDFECYPQPSFLFGEWSKYGWRYYYIVGLLLKNPIAVTLLVCWGTRVSWKNRKVEDAVLVAPPLVLLVLVSSQVEFNHHVRYAYPILPFAYIAAGAVLRDAIKGRARCAAALLVASTIITGIAALRDPIGYMNPFASLSKLPPLLHSNVEWGQHLYRIEALQADGSLPPDLIVLCDCGYAPNAIGVGEPISSHPGEVASHILVDVTSLSLARSAYSGSSPISKVILQHCGVDDAAGTCLGCFYLFKLRRPVSSASYSGVVRTSDGHGGN